MAATTEAVLSVAELRRELRIGIEDTNPETAALVEAQRDSAVSAVSEYLAAPLVDTTETLRPSRPDDATAPLVLYAPGSALVSLRYWSTSGALRLDPDGEIPLQDLGRTQRAGFRFLIWPPADGWPEVLAGSQLELEVRRGIDPIPKALRQACVLAARAYYDGDRTVTSRAAMFALIGPWRQIAAAPRGPLSR